MCTSAIFNAKRSASAISVLPGEDRNLPGLEPPTACLPKFK